MSRTILSLARIPQLAQARAAALQQAGFSVTTAKSGLEAVLLMLHERFDLLILGHSVSNPEDEDVARIAAASKVPVLSLSRPLGCGEHFDVAAGPDAFLARVLKLTGREEN